MYTRRASVAFLVFLAVAGCSGDPHDIAPPANPGSAESLAGTTWEWEGLLITFQSAPSASVQRQRAAGRAGPPVPMHYEFENGVIRMNVLGEKKGATWDGQSLVIDGVPATRRSGQTN